jgi:hypothetical protein
MCSQSLPANHQNQAKALDMSSLRAGNMASELHLYQWPGTAARSYATWMWRP